MLNATSSVVARRALSVLALTAAVSTAGLGVLAGTAQAASTGAALGVVRGTDAPGAIAGRYIVVLNNPASAAVDSSLAGTVGGTVTSTYHTAVQGFSAVLSPSGAQRLAGTSGVAFVEQDRQVSIAATQTNPASWGLDRIDQPNLPLDHTYTAGSAARVHAYIIDTGIRMTQTQYAGRVTSGWDFVDNDANASDCQGHGSHVAGTVGGKDYGVAKDVRLVSVRVLNCQGSGSYSQIIAGVDWVTAHAVKPAVANMSLAGTAGSALDAAVQRSINSGVTYVVAAGNDATNACTESPARVADAITVGASDNKDQAAHFSDYGTCVDLYAPGVNILSSSIKSDTATAIESGTSMASPHVTGAAALYLQNHPTATPKQVHDALITHATTGKLTSLKTGSPNLLLNITGL